MLYARAGSKNRLRRNVLHDAILVSILVTQTLSELVSVHVRILRLSMTLAASCLRTLHHRRYLPHLDPAYLHHILIRAQARLHVSRTTSPAHLHPSALHRPKLYHQVPVSLHGFHAPKSIYSVMPRMCVCLREAAASLSWIEPWHNLRDSRLPHHMGLH